MKGLDEGSRTEDDLNESDPAPKVGTDAFFILRLHLPREEKPSFQSVSKSRKLLGTLLGLIDGAAFERRRNQPVRE